LGLFYFSDLAVGSSTTMLPGAHPREGFWGSKPLPLEAKAMLLKDGVVRQLSNNDNIHSGSNHNSNQILKNVPLL